jgi:hypothetical protein
MANLLRARGLYTFQNELTVPEGALTKADNVVIDEDGVVQPRRGLKEYGDSFGTGSDVLNQLAVYKSRILRHYNTTLQFDSDGSGTFSAFNGSYSELVAGLRLKFLEANSNLYFTTSDGIKKISASSNSDFSTAANYITNAGGVKALDVQGLVKFESGGFLPAESKVAYRIVWGINDKNNNLILGSPSSRLVMTNTIEDIDLPEISSITIGTYGSIVASDYILFSSTTADYFLWFDVAGSDPAPVTSETVGRTGIEVDINGLSSNAEVANAIANILGANTDFETSVNSNVVTIENVSNGVVTAIAEMSGGVAGVTVSTDQAGEETAGQRANVDLTFTVPDAVINTDHFYQIYRTGITTAGSSQTVNDIDPGDEMNLIYESGVTTAQITAGEVTFDDDISDAFRESGALLYTNPNSGEGILQANERPPIAKDLALFRNSTFYANTETAHRSTINLLSVTGFTSGVSDFIIGNSTTTREYVFIGATQVQQIDTVDDVADSLDGTYFLINSARNENKYYVWFNTGAGAGDPAISNRVGIQVDITTGDADTAVATALKLVLDAHADFSAAVSTNEVTVTWAKNGNVDDALDGDTGFTFNTPSTEGDGEARYGTISAITATSPAQVTITDHGLETGDNVFITDSDSGISIDGEWSATVIDDDTFSVPVDNSPGSGGSVGTTGSMYQLDVLLSSLSSAGQAIDETARSLVKTINKDPAGPVYAFYLSGPDDLPGIILLENRDLTDEPFYVSTNDSNIISKFTPELSATEAITAISLADPTQITSATHGLTTGDEVYIYNTDSVPALLGKYEVTVVDGNNFTVDVNVTTGGTTGLWFLADVASDNEEKPNRVYYSKPNQPEAVPIVNYLDIGGQDAPIHRILALRDNLFVLKSDGIYIVTGPSAPDFSPRLIDDDVILAPDSAVVLNNSIYALTTQGIVAISETGPGIISRPIEDQILKVANPRYDYKTIAFGVAYEKDRAYFLWLPTDTTDAVATQCFRYNIFTRTWTRWTKSGTCGIVSEDADRLFVGAGDTNYLLQERKLLDRTDYADRDFSATITSCTSNGLNVCLNAVTDIEVGDVLLQEQYVTISQFNRLLLKLDIDQGLDDTDYYSTLVLSAGDNMKTQLDALNIKLVADDSSGTITAKTFSADPETQQTELNVMIGQLNDSGCDTQYKNYIESTGTVSYEGIVREIDSINLIVTLNQSIPLLEAAVTIFEMYSQEIIWKPQHFGDAAALKQVKEGSIIFDQDQFYSINYSYSSDLNPSFVGAEDFGNGPGYWGIATWGNIYWGGDGNDAPLRAFVPRDKQRCRYLTARIVHNNAREGFRILGISMEPRLLSKRAYR